MTREEALAAVKAAFIAEADNDWQFEDDAEQQAYVTLVNNATSLSELAIFHQDHAWDIAQFVGLILKALGFEDQDLDDKWLNEHGYGWDT